MKPHDQRGFTLPEVATTLAIVGILMRIALPTYERVMRDARAAQVIGHFNTVRAAAFAYNADTNQWPADSETGDVPAELKPYLPRGYSFDNTRYQLDWENWILPNGLPKYPATQVLLGVSVSTTDEALGNRLVTLLGTSSAAYTMGNKYTFLFLASGSGTP